MKPRPKTPRSQPPGKRPRGRVPRRLRAVPGWLVQCLEISRARMLAYAAAWHHRHR